MEKAVDEVEAGAEEAVEEGVERCTGAWKAGAVGKGIRAEAEREAVLGWQYSTMVRA
jgi:hypothetical protein